MKVLNLTAAVLMLVASSIQAAEHPSLADSMKITTGDVVTTLHVPTEGLPKGKEWTIRANNTTYDSKNNHYIFAGNVSLAASSVKIAANEMVLDVKEKQGTFFSMKGNVVIQVFEGEKQVVELKAEQAQMEPVSSK